MALFVTNEGPVKNEVILVEYEEQNKSRLKNHVMKHVHHGKYLAKLSHMHIAEILGRSNTIDVIFCRTKVLTTYLKRTEMVVSTRTFYPL